MSAPEVWWRVGARVQDWVDRWAAPVRRRPAALERIATLDGASFEFNGQAIGAPPAAEPGVGGCAERMSRLVARADRLAENRVSLFDLVDLSLGEPIDWNYEYKAGRPAPRDFAGSIDYRDYRRTGDCKFVWELNRHHHWVVLGRAYRASGDRHYAEVVVRQLASWIEQCPYASGMNWRSPLELAIRLINWCWALELIRPSGLLTPELRADVLRIAHRHLWDIARKYSRYSSANNHLIGEAAGVFVGSAYFHTLNNAAAWRAHSRSVLLREILHQTDADGVHRELATGYHLFVLQFFVIAGVVARNIGEDFSAEYWNRLERMFEFLTSLARGGDRLPMFGDADDGYVLDLGSGQGSLADWLAVGAALFKRSDFKAAACEAAGTTALDGAPAAGARTPPCGEAVYWLLGEQGLAAFEALEPEPAGPLRSTAYPDAGYYLLQSGTRGAGISVTFDCGPLGFGTIAAHGHADALSFTLRALGRDVLVDPGTYDYFTHEPWRTYFRSTRAHNTIVVDGVDQSEMLGLFLWGRRASSRCLEWSPNSSGGTVAAEHDGYSALPGGVVHRRTLQLGGRELTVRDELTGGGEHHAALCLQFAEQCQAARVDDQTWSIDFGPGTVSVRFDARWSVAMHRGAERPIFGWVSRGYHRKEPATTLVAECRWRERLDSKVVIRVCPA